MVDLSGMNSAERVQYTTQLGIEGGDHRAVAEDFAAAYDQLTSAEARQVIDALDDDPAEFGDLLRNIDRRLTVDERRDFMNDIVTTLDADGILQVYNTLGAEGRGEAQQVLGDALTSSRNAVHDSVKVDVIEGLRDQIDSGPRAPDQVSPLATVRSTEDPEAVLIGDLISSMQSDGGVRVAIDALNDAELTAVIDAAAQNNNVLLHGATEHRLDTSGFERLMDRVAALDASPIGGDVRNATIKARVFDAAMGVMDNTYYGHTNSLNFDLHPGAVQERMLNAVERLLHSDVDGIMDRFIQIGDYTDGQALRSFVTTALNRDEPERIGRLHAAVSLGDGQLTLVERLEQIYSSAAGDIYGYAQMVSYLNTAVGIAVEDISNNRSRQEDLVFSILSSAATFVPGGDRAITYLSTLNTIASAVETDSNAQLSAQLVDASRPLNEAGEVDLHIDARGQMTTIRSEMEQLNGY